MRKELLKRETSVNCKELYRVPDGYLIQFYEFSMRLKRLKRKPKYTLFFRLFGDALNSFDDWNKR